MADLEKLLERGQKKSSGYVLNDASDYFASVLPEKVDGRAWNHLLIYAPTSSLVKALWFRCTKRFRYRWRH